MGIFQIRDLNSASGVPYQHRVIGNAAVPHTAPWLAGELILTVAVPGNAPGKQGHPTQTRSSSAASVIKLLSLTVSFNSPL